jgi:plastocyanin
MVKQLAATAILAGIVALAAVACGGGDDEDSAAPPPPAAAAAPAQEATAEPQAAAAEGTDEEKTRYKGGLVPTDALVPVDLSKEGDVIDLTVTLYDGTMYIYGTPPMRYEPKDMTFKVGQTVNFTLEFADANSRFKHSFTSFDLGFDEKAAWGQTTTFTHTFDKAGFFFVRSTSHHQMTGTITVVE